MKQALLYDSPVYSIGDKVIYASRIQDRAFPYTITGIRDVKGYCEYQVNNFWWRAGNLTLWTKEVAARFGL